MIGVLNVFRLRAKQPVKIQRFAVQEDYVLNAKILLIVHQNQEQLHVIHFLTSVLQTAHLISIVRAVQIKNVMLEKQTFV